MSSGLYTFRERAPKVPSTPIQTTSSGSSSNLTTTSKSTSTSSNKSNQLTPSTSSKPKTKSTKTKSKKQSATSPSQSQSQELDGSSELSEHSEVEGAIKKRKGKVVEKGEYKLEVSESSEEIEDDEGGEEDYQEKPSVNKKTTAVKRKASAATGTKRGPYKKRKPATKVKKEIDSSDSQSRQVSAPTPFGPDYASLAKIQTPNLNYLIQNYNAVLQEARIEATRNQSLQIDSQRAVEQLISTLEAGFEEAFCLTMNRYSAFCTAVKVPTYPITHAKVAIHLARVLPTPLGAELRRIIPHSRVHGLPVTPLVIGGPPLSIGEGSRVTRELVRNWGEALAYCQSNTTTIWDSRFNPSTSGGAAIGEGITLSKSIMEEQTIKEILNVLAAADQEYAKDPRLNNRLPIPTIPASNFTTPTTSTVRAVPSSKVQTSLGNQAQSWEESDSLADSEELGPERKRTKWSKGGHEVGAPVASPVPESRSRQHSRASSSSFVGLAIPLVGEAIDSFDSVTPQAVSPATRSNSINAEVSGPSTLPFVDHSSPILPIPVPPNFVVPTQIPPRSILQPPPVEPWERYATPRYFNQPFGNSSTSRPIVPPNYPTQPTTKAPESSLSSFYVSRITPSPDQTLHNKVWGAQPYVPPAPLSTSQSHSQSHSPYYRAHSHADIKSLQSQSQSSSIYPQLPIPNQQQQQQPCQVTQASVSALDAIAAVASGVVDVAEDVEAADYSGVVVGSGEIVEVERWGSDDSQGQTSRFDESSTRGKDEVEESSLETSSVVTESNLIPDRQLVSSPSILVQQILGSTTEQLGRPPHLTVDTSLRRTPTPNSAFPTTANSGPVPVTYAQTPNYQSRFNVLVPSPHQSHLQHQQHSNLSRQGSPTAFVSGSNPVQSSQFRDQSWNGGGLVANNNGSLSNGNSIHSSDGLIVGGNSMHYNPQSIQALGLQGSQYPYHLSPSQQAYLSHHNYGLNIPYQPYGTHNQPSNLMGNSSYYVPSSYHSPGSIPYNPNYRIPPPSNYPQHTQYLPQQQQQQQQQHFAMPPPNTTPHQEMRRMNYSVPSNSFPIPQSMTNHSSPSTSTSSLINFSSKLNNVDQYGRSFGMRTTNLPGNSNTYNGEEYNQGSDRKFGEEAGVEAEAEAEVEIVSGENNNSGRNSSTIEGGVVFNDRAPISPPLAGAINYVENDRQVPTDPGREFSRNE